MKLELQGADNLWESSPTKFFREEKYSEEKGKIGLSTASEWLHF